MNTAGAAASLQVIRSSDFEEDRREALEILRQAWGLNTTRPAAAGLPFSHGDATAGCENELQAVVQGSPQAVDLPLTIIGSNYYQNLHKRAAAGDLPPKVIQRMDDFLHHNPTRVWENSWVRFPRRQMSDYTRRVFSLDILADKQNPVGPLRKDAGRFSFVCRGEEYLRIPVSYLLKLSLAQAVSQQKTPPLIRSTAEDLMAHFLSDNTSPETFSFHAPPLTGSRGYGRGLARETLKRFLLCQLLTFYANASFGLADLDQRVIVYFAPHPPIRQKRLNDLISDAFYRELFMSPCLSGWNRGEAKHQYMILCHQVLSRSHLNAVAKLRDANIIHNNLVVLPNTSNVSLANNGTHVSLGSRRLTQLLQDPASGYGAPDEKYFGDLVIKIVEHFLPLFVGTYSADPYRLDFWDLHPEKVLGFLPHELDFTHLRMIWRRWKRKAQIKVLGHPVTPFGPLWLDRLICRAFALKGDFVLDFRLIDYLVALMSTDQSPALNGRLDSDGALKKDLFDMGVFDTGMPLYLLYRLRRYDEMGFSGFEGRYYSVFENIHQDMGEAVNLQMLITALAYRYVLQEQVSHRDIPDSPAVESERRQVFFGTAIGIPTFYVYKNSPNRFFRRLLQQVKNTRPSRRYPGYLRVVNKEYRRALLEVLRADAADLIEAMDLTDTLAHLHDRIHRPEESAAVWRMTRGITANTVKPKKPMKLYGFEFNAAAEAYYREDLRKQHLLEGLTVLQEDLQCFDRWDTWREGCYNQPLLSILDGQSAAAFLAKVQSDLVAERLSADMLQQLIHLVILSVHRDMHSSEGA